MSYPQRLGRSPTLAELAAHLDLTEEEVQEALEVAGTRAPPAPAERNDLSNAQTLVHEAITLPAPPSRHSRTDH
jgi:DNA-directed RNA polymerase specialized sigma subunit